MKWLVGGAIAAVVAAGVFALIAVVGQQGGGGPFRSKRVLDLAYMPPDAKQVLVMRPRDVWQSEVIQTKLEAAQSDDATFFRNTHGVAPTDVESVTTFKGDKSRLSVVRLYEAIDPEQIVSKLLEAEPFEHNGRAGWRFLLKITLAVSVEPYRSPRALMFADERTILVGGEKSVTAAMDRGPDPPERREFEFADPDVELFHASAGIGWDAWHDSPAAVVDHPLLYEFHSEGQEFNQNYAGGIQAMSRETSYTDRVTETARVIFHDVQTAADAVEWLDSKRLAAIEQRKKNLEENKRDQERAAKAERARVERQAAGRNPFGLNMKDSLEKLQERQARLTAQLEMLRTTRVTHNWNQLTLVSQIVDPGLDVVGSREDTRRSMLVDLGEQLGWKGRILDLRTPAAESATSPAAAPALTADGAEAKTPGRETIPVDVHTYSITFYGGNETDVARIEASLEEHLSAVNGYIPGSVRVDVAKARVSIQVRSGGLFGHLPPNVDMAFKRASMMVWPENREEQQIEVDAAVAAATAPREPASYAPSWSMVLDIRRDLRGDRTDEELRSAADEALASVPSYVAGSVEISPDRQQLRFRTGAMLTPQIAINALRTHAGLEAASPLSPRRPESQDPGKVTLKIVGIRDGARSDTELERDAEEALREVPGYVADSVQISPDRKQLTLDIAGGTVQRTPTQTRLFEGAGIATESPGRTSTLPPAGTEVRTRIIVYYTDYGGADGVDAGARTALAKLPAVIAGSLKVDAENKWIRFESETGLDAKDVLQSFRAAGFQTKGLSIGVEPEQTKTRSAGPGSGRG